jgi:hypothetical protein
VAVLYLRCCRPVRPRTGVNQCSVQVGYDSVGVMLLEYRTVILHSGKLRPLSRGMDYLQRSVSYRGSSSDVMGNLPPSPESRTGYGGLAGARLPLCECPLLALYQFGMVAVKHVSPDQHYGVDVSGQSS